MRYKNESDLIMYQICNEPHDVDDFVWGGIQQNIINVIRKNDSTHTIVVSPANWSSYSNLQKLPDYEDDNLIYDFHFYQPMVFTHQRASFIDPATTSLMNVPFPYDPARMPPFPDDLKGTWFENSFKEYDKIGTVKYLKEQIDIAIQFRNSRNVRIFCGELGVHIPGAPRADRIFWYETVCSYLKENDIPFAIWDYKDVFGIFNYPAKIFPDDLNSELLKVIGFNDIEKPQIKPNFDFEDGTTNGWISKSWEGSMLMDIDEYDPLSGTKSLLVTILTSTGNHILNEDFWKQNIRYRTPIIKGAKYKISFKAMASDPCSIIGSFDQNFAPYKQIDHHTFNISTIPQTYEYTTDTFPEVVGAGSFAFYFGHLEAGTQIWLDDISITEVTYPLTDGNICNGDFESDVANAPYYSAPQLYGWSKHLDGATVNYEIDEVSPISGNKSMKITGVGTPASNPWKAQLIWVYSPVLGQQWMCEFKARSTANFVMTVESFDSWLEGGRNNNLFKSEFQITPEIKTYKLDAPTAVQNQHDSYFLAFWVGNLPDGASVWIDDVKFYKYDNNYTNINPIFDESNNIKIINNTGGLLIETSNNADVYIYNYIGQLIKISKINTGFNHIAIDKGIYIVKVIENNTIIKRSKVVVS
jgi:hypothetical protein